MKVLQIRQNLKSGPSWISAGFVKKAGFRPETEPNSGTALILLISYCLVLCCRYIRTGSDFYGDTVRRYVEFDAEDDTYNIMQHFDIAFDIIEDARKSGGRALIHCIMGVNRSGALAVAYTMLHRQCGPITAAVYVREKRRMLLSNEDFQEQLIEFARQQSLLHLDAKEISGSSSKS